MATMTPEIKAAIEAALQMYRREHSYYGTGMALRMSLDEMRAKYEAADAALAYIQDAPQPVAPDALAAHWPQLPELDGIDRFAEYPITGDE